MAETTFAALVTKNNANVRKALSGGVLIGQSTATVPSALTADSAETPGTPVLQTLTGYSSLGWFNGNGAKFSENISSADIKAWGSLEPVRRDITSDITTVNITALETNKATIATYFDVDPATLVPNTTTAELAVPKNVSPVARYYRVLVLSQDGAAGSEYWIGRLMPRAGITNRGDMIFMSDQDAIVHDLTFTAYTDATAGYSVMTFYAGPGWKTNKTAAGF